MPKADQLLQIAEQIRDGKPVSVTVREFLSWFGAKRRGFWIVSRIKEALSQAGLKTEPDFESAYLDSAINFMLAGCERPDASPSPQTIELTASASAFSLATATLNRQTSYADPTYRISKLRTANIRPTSVKPDDSLSEAVTLMLANDFSQLPVMTNERDVKGIIRWSSIGARIALRRNGTYVRELMDRPHQEIRADASIFEVMPIIVQHQYALVRSAEAKITGIITATDLNTTFQQLGEPFLLLGEIENHIRRIIADRFSQDELASARDPSDTNRQVDRVSDLTFGKYIKLLENPGRWARLEIEIDRAVFCNQLDRVRHIRNDVMHFDPDGIPDEDLDQLRHFSKFLFKLQTIGIC